MGVHMEEVKKENPGCNKCGHHKRIDIYDYCKEIRGEAKSAAIARYMIDGDCDKLNKNLDCEKWTEKKPGMIRRLFRLLF